MGIPAAIETGPPGGGQRAHLRDFDIDSLDPAFAPGTGTPEAGGLTPREVWQCCAAWPASDIIGGDVVEVAPQYDPTTNTAQVAAQMLFTELCLIALDPAFKRRARAE